MTAAGVAREHLQRLSAPSPRARLLAHGLACAAALACAAPVHAATRELVVDAPSPFKALLEKNLDIERAARLGESDSLDDTEWARLIADVAMVVCESEGGAGQQGRGDEKCLHGVSMVGSSDAAREGATRAISRAAMTPA